MASSSSRPSDPAGLVSCAWRKAAAVPASRSGPGRWANSARISSRFATGSGIGVLLCRGSYRSRERTQAKRTPSAGGFGYRSRDDRSRPRFAPRLAVGAAVGFLTRIPVGGAVGGRWLWPMQAGRSRWSAPVSERSAGFVFACGSADRARRLAAGTVGDAGRPAVDRGAARGRPRRRRRRAARRRTTARAGSRSCATAGTVPTAVLALVLSVGLRAAALAQIGEALHAGLALVAAHAASRAMLPAVMRVLPAARDDGLGATAGRPGAATAIVAALIGAGIGLAALGPSRGAVALAVAAAAVPRGGGACPASGRRLHRRCAGGPSADRRDRHVARRGGKMSEIATRFWWVRHAPVAHGGRIYGQTDLSCDCSEAALFAGLATQLPADAVWVTSNLRRTHETAAAIIRAGVPGPCPVPGPEAKALSDLAEQNFGEWQGLTYEALSQSRNGDFHRFWHAPAHQAPPGGESFLAVAERVSRAIHQLVEAHPGSRHHRRRPWRHDPRRAGAGARSRSRGGAGIFDRQLLGHPHRPD